MRIKSIMYGVVGSIIIFVSIFTAFALNPFVKSWVLIHLPSVGNGLTYVAFSSPVEERYNLAYGHFHSASEYRNLSRAESLLLPLDTDEQSLYLLARVHFGMQDTAKVIETADRYLAQFPNEQRMHYIRGLAHAYEDNWEQSEQDFKTFMAFAPDEWAGYLDLSWVYFQTGRMTEAREVIEEAYGKFDNNPWISAAFGVVLFNQEEFEYAEFVLKGALEEADELSFEQWAAAYSATGVVTAREELDEFKQVIAYNLQLVQNPDEISLDEVQSVYNVRFADPSLQGVGNGLHVSACNSSCPACNVCGDCTGNSNQHLGSTHSASSCSEPGLPSGYGNQCVSANNVCAQNNTGTIGCAGCTASVPEAPLPNANGYLYVAHNEQVYIYEASNFTSSTPAQNCYSFTNTTGQGVFVPMNSVPEFESFVGADVFSEEANLDLNPL